MFKVNLILAIMLAAAVMCLSACGEGKDTDATPLQSTADQSSSKIQETASSTDASVLQGSSESASIIGDAADPQDGGDTTSDGEDSAKNDKGTVTSSQKSDDANVSQDTEKTDTDGGTNRDDDRQSAEPDSGQPAAAASRSPEERDNAEVNINDL